LKKIILITLAILLLPSFAFAKVNWTSGYDRANGTHYWLEEDGTLKPGTTNNVNLGTTALELKKAYWVDGWTCAFVFGSPDIAASTTFNATTGDWGLPVLGTTDNNFVTKYTMPFAGNVLAVSAYARTAITAHYVSFDVTINDVKTGLVTDLEQWTDTTADADSQAGGLDTFSAADKMGVAVTTPASFTPTTNDYTIVVIVGFDL